MEAVELELLLQQQRQVIQLLAQINFMVGQGAAVGAEV
jgi:hypothetical protein